MMKKTLSLFLAFFKIGAFTFCGGYAMIALLENEFVEKESRNRLSVQKIHKCFY